MFVLEYTSPPSCLGSNPSIKSSDMFRDCRDPRIEDRNPRLAENFQVSHKNTRICPSNYHNFIIHLSLWVFRIYRICNLQGVKERNRESTRCNNY